MKVYIASENSKQGIILSNALNASSINTAQNDAAYANMDSMLNDISGNVQSFDMCFAISRKPIDFVMSANKMASLRAVFCRNARDIIEARKAGANVVILDSDSISRDSIYSLIGDWMANEGFQLQSVAKAISGLISVKSRPAAPVSAPSIAQQQRQKQRKKAEEDHSESEADDGREGKPKSGIIGKLKDAFGFE
ncbi:MAG: hypothetical protein QXW10_03640 [Candidatus Micrarchaeaceae archaeon]